MLLFLFIPFFFGATAPAGACQALFHGKRKLLIQGRKSIFKKTHTFWRFQKLGASESYPTWSALSFGGFKSRKGSIFNIYKNFGPNVVYCLLPHPRDPPSRAFDHLIKGCLYWISHSIMDSTLDKRGNPLNSRSIYWDTQLMIFFLFKFWALYCMCVCLFASLLSRPPGAKDNGTRSLLIQGRMQIFAKTCLFGAFQALGPI